MDDFDGWGLFSNIYTGQDISELISSLIQDAEHTKPNLSELSVLAIFKDDSAGFIFGARLATISQLDGALWRRPASDSELGYDCYEFISSYVIPEIRDLEARNALPM